MDIFHYKSVIIYDNVIPEQGIDNSILEDVKTKLSTAENCIVILLLALSSHGSKFNNKDRVNNS